MGIKYDDLYHPVIIVGLVLVCSLLWRLISYLFVKLTHKEEKANKVIVEELRELNKKVSELITCVTVLTGKSSDFNDALKHTNFSLKQAKEQLHEHSKILAIQTEKLKHLESRNKSTDKSSGSNHYH